MVPKKTLTEVLLYCDLLTLENALVKSLPLLEIDMKTRFEDEIQILRQQRKRLVLSTNDAGTACISTTKDTPTVLSLPTSQSVGAKIFTFVDIVGLTATFVIFAMGLWATRQR